MSKIQQTNGPQDMRALTLPFDSQRCENDKGEFETTLFIPTAPFDSDVVYSFFNAAQNLGLGLTDSDIQELLNSAKETGMVRKLVRSIVRGS